MGKKFVLSQEDGTVAGGNARGDGAVDLQITRTNANEVASGNYSVVLGGESNRAAQTGSVVIGGRINQCTGTNSVAGGDNSNVSGNASIGIGSDLIVSGANATAFGRTNTASSQYSTVSGGQSNTASTGTHATVVGGSGNAASGVYSVCGGQTNTASGAISIALGTNNTTAGSVGVSIGANNSSSAGSVATCIGNANISRGDTSMAIGRNNDISGYVSVGLGGFNTVSGDSSLAIGSYNLITGSGIACGNTTTIISPNSGNTFGLRSLSYLYSQSSIGSGIFGVNNGEAQQSLLTARSQAALTTAATTVLSLDGTGVTNLIIPNGNNRAWNVQVNWVSVVTAITGTATGISVGDVVTSVDLLAFKKIGGVSSASAHTSAATKTMVTTPAAYAACAIAYTAGASQEMALTFTGPTFVDGGSVTMRVVARIELAEVAF